MKNKFLLITILLALALVTAACGAQDTTQTATNEPGEATADSTVATEESAATEDAGGAETTPTVAAEAGTPAGGTTEAGTTPTVSPDGATSVPQAGGTAGIPQTGAGEAGVPDDLPEAVRVLQAAGATVEIGDEVQQDAVSATGRIVRINGEEVQFFTYNSAESLEVEASQLANQADPEREQPYYKLGTMLVFYPGRDPGVRDLLENVLGAHSAAE